MSKLRAILLSGAIAAMAAACGASAATSAAPTAAVSARSAPASAPSVAPSVATVSPSIAPAAAPSVTLSEWKVVVSGTIKAGNTNLEIKDAGVAAHEMLVFKSDRKPSAYPLDKAGDIIEDGAGVDLISDGENIDSGGTQTRTLDLAPGTYLFVCNIPGHFKQGMYATVIVAP